MKWGKLLSVVLIIVLLFIVIPFSDVKDVKAVSSWNVDASQFPYAKVDTNAIYISKIAGYPADDVATAISSGSITINISGSNGYNYSNTYSTSNSGQVIYGQDGYNTDAYFFKFYIGTTLTSGVNYVVNITFNNANFYTSYYNWVFNGSMSLKFTSNGTSWVSTSNAQASFKLVYNNDYNYTSNTASFTLQYSNFSFNYFTYLNTDAPGGSSLHLQTYNITQNGSTYVVHCTFDNSYVNLSNPHYLFWTVHGLDINGNPIDLNGSTSFNLNAPNVPQVPKGVLVITSPQTGDNFASGTTQIPVSVVYGGDVTDVTDPNYNHTSVTVGAVKALHNAGSVDLTSYSVISGTTVWSGTLTLNSGEGDGEYTLMASLDGTILTSDTITITIGGSTGNAVLDFLKAVWDEFKEWFVNTMKLLFVPNATDFSSQIAQGWVQVANPLPSVTPLYTIDIPMSTALGTKNGVATIDFKTPITSWSGYPTMQSVIRVGLYTLLVFVIWSMVT
jgi:hypothetical protein